MAAAARARWKAAKAAGKTRLYQLPTTESHFTGARSLVAEKLTLRCNWVPEKMIAAIDGRNDTVAHGGTLGPSVRVPIGRHSKPGNFHPHWFQVGFVERHQLNPRRVARSERLLQPLLCRLQITQLAGVAGQVEEDR